MYPSDLKYTKDHEWIRVGKSTAQVGVTAYAQQQLGDVVFIDLPNVGCVLAKGEQFGSIESVKAVSDLYSPASGEVVEVNELLADKPESVNQDPHGTWLVVLKLSNLEEIPSLLDANGYTDLIA